MEVLYKKVSMPLFSILLRMLKTESIAEEADRAAPLAWMSRIARNQALDTLRYQRVRLDHDLNHDNSLLDSIAAPASDDSPDQLATRAILIDCLSRLTDKPRYCVVKAYVEGYSHEELSSQMGSPIGTVKSWIRRSLVALKRCLDEHD